MARALRANIVPVTISLMEITGPVVDPITCRNLSVSVVGLPCELMQYKTHLFTIIDPIR